MKSTGIAWLPEVGDEWETYKVAHGFSAVGSGTTPNTENHAYYDGDVPWVTTSELRETVITDTTKKVTKQALHEHPALKLFPEGTLLIAMYGATIGRLGVLGVPACMNQACCALGAGTFLDSRFVYYWLLGFRENVIQLASGGGQPNISQEKIRSLRIPAPSRGAQVHIATFLDRRTAAIDTLIAKKERLIDLLQEKRQALITQAVTRGLNPDMPMKESGIKDIGAIPQGWAVTTIRRITANHKQGFYTNDPYVDDGTRLARITDIDDMSNVTYDDMPFVNIDPGTRRAFEVRDGDFLFARSGSLGRFGIARDPPPCVFASYLIRFRFKRVLPNFVRYWLLSDIFQCGIRRMHHGGANQNVHAEDIKGQPIVVPPKETQETICAYLDGVIPKLESVTERIGVSMGQLHEYRGALITAAVTGRIDVSKEAA